MEEQHVITPDRPGAADFGQSLREERSRVHDFVRGYQRQLAEIEERLESELAQAQQALPQVDEVQRHNADDQSAAWADHRRQLAELVERLEARRGEHAQALDRLRADRDATSGEIAARQADLERQTAEASERAGEQAALLHEREARAAAKEKDLARLVDRNQAEFHELAAERKRLEQRQEELEREHAEMLAGRERLTEQRRRVAEDFREQRSAHFAQLDRRRQELDATFAEQRGKFEQSLADARRQIGRLDEQLRQAHSERDAARQELAAARQELAAARRGHEALDHKFATLTSSHDDLRQQLTDRQVKLASVEQRQRELEDERDDLLRQVAQASRREGTAAHQTADQNAESDQALLQLTAQLAAARDQTAAAQAERNAAQEEAARTKAAAANLKEQLATAGDAEEVERLREELVQAEREKRRLESELAEAVAQFSRQTGDEGEEAADLKSRLTMALDDLRAEKARNGELQRKVLTAAQNGNAPAAGGGGMDWESQKRRMLASLEADGEVAAPERAAERLKIEDAIQATEQAVAEKDSEIGELKKLLEEQSGNWGNVAVGAAAIADVLDKDEIVRQEREGLQSLQTEWREKLRQAEVDISVERAKLARDRADLEEKLRVLEQHQPPADGKGAKSPPEKPQRGRWLARLGLKDQAEE